MPAEKFNRSSIPAFQTTGTVLPNKIIQHILLIDDEPQITEDILSLYGYHVVVCNDGYEGIQQLFANPKIFDMVILDITMPRMNGWNVLKLIRNGDECPNIPIIMLTASTEEDSLIAALRRGADEYLTKPISPSRLLAHVEAIFRRSSWDEKRTMLNFDPETQVLQASVKLLTQRENEILRYLIQGHSNQEIGQHLVISETTVKNHLAHIFKKLKVSNRTQAAYIAQKLNFQAG